MATRTFIDGGKQAITFNNDTEPVAVYVDGELQQNVSFVPQLAQGTGSVQYISEYKKNIINLEVSGATSQIGTPTPETPIPIENANDVVLLSKEYQQVEYIESTGTQYIDTGVFPTIDTVVEISCLNKSNSKFIYGSRTSAASTDKHCVLFQPSSADIYALFGNSTVVNSNFVFDDNTIYKVKNGKDGCYINDVKIRDYGNASFGYTTLSLYLFAINTPAEDYAERAFVGNIYSCKIYEGETLVRNFIPCYRKTDNVIGMFELVNGTFYTNQGTGNFNKGIDLNSNVAIKNTLVALHGDNLYNISIVKGATTNINVPDIPRSKQYGSITDGVLHLKYGVYAGGTIWTNAKIRIEKGGNYYVTVDVYASSETVYKRFVARFHNATKKATTYFLSFNISETDIWQRYEFFITVPDDWVGDAVYLCLMSGGGVEQYNDIPMYAKNIMITYGEPKDYEPYFREEISVPPSVEVDNGDGTTKTVDLPFTIYDKLIVDRVANTVTYEKKSGVKVFTGNENFDIGTSNVPNAYEYNFPLARAGFNITTANGYCTHFTPVTAENISKIGDVCFILSPTNRPYMSFVYDDFGYSLSEFELAEEEFESWVAEQYSAGTPLTIVVEYEEVEPIDITQSSLAQSLLNLATQNQTNYFEITSNEKAPQVPIKINYAKWGELVENNNNT